MDDAAALAFVKDGFEVALHVTSNCLDWTPRTLGGFYSEQIARFRTELRSVPAVQTNRTHCVVWSDYVTQAKVARAYGIRLDTNYYFYPAEWVQNRPGLFTGSAMPMRFGLLPWQQSQRANRQMFCRTQQADWDRAFTSFQPP